MLQRRSGVMAQDNDKPQTPGGSAGANAVVRINSSDLLQGQKEIVILHEGSEYRLRITSQNKLILTK